MTVWNVGITQKIVGQKIEVNGTCLQVQAQSYIGESIFINSIRGLQGKYVPKSSLIKTLFCLMGSP